ncbi:hypothetical protein SAICODRAFT_32067 [Saitoella complicata NRRL Y-17804]|uniref:uncharacterized protein n=1 Tax=Saitoella complicata (strain BCRC 22490 / CBS 7301 / JCM 7358 / NBRC 10748 / NRRL Y-17804) TaxID=698492 RepID=UPI0008678D78|nr:uncharacterized protein SAICODRAFT_32067 [Saitoella complicata NRRL Y-17804]ODQ50073.1 hypothetical protein SAICODRAFT_32067 [Saitoella complicata NRRL Y-17804]
MNPNILTPPRGGQRPRMTHPNRQTPLHPRPPRNRHQINLEPIWSAYMRVDSLPYQTRQILDVGVYGDEGMDSAVLLVEVEGAVG